MSPQRLARLLFLVFILPPLTGCEVTGDPRAITDPDESEDVFVTLKNRDTQRVHLFLTAKGQTFGCCSVEKNDSIPGQLIQGVTQVAVQAGRDQQIIGSITCKILRADVNSRHKAITWLGGGKWMCT